MFSFTLRMCLKESIAVDVEGGKRRYHLLCAFTTLVGLEGLNINNIVKGN